MVEKKPKRSGVKRLPRLQPSDEARYFRDVQANASVLGRQVADWLRDTARVAQAVARGNTDLAPLFWIRVYGVLCDIDDKVRRQNDFAREHGAPLGAIPEIMRSIDAIASLFTRDELIYLQYRRHVDCHPFQDSYRIDVTSRGLRDSVFHRLLSEPLTVEATNGALDRMLREYGSELEVAEDFARRSAAQLAELPFVAAPWCGI